MRSRSLAAVAAACCWALAAHAAEKPRVASINVCTDQLLLTLADPEQILGLSPYAGDPARAWRATDAGRYRRLSGDAEDVLILKPDIVVATPFTKRATREFLKAQNFRLEEFDSARTVADVKAQIVRMGQLLAQPERAARETARIDAAVARARAAASRKKYRVLAVSRRGWVAGANTLVASLLATVGLSDVAAELGVDFGSFVSLEEIVAAKPDLLLVSSHGGFAEDQGQSFLLHPALEALYPAQKRLVVPEYLTVCGGPMLAEALDRLTAEIERISR